MRVVTNRAMYPIMAVAVALAWLASSARAEDECLTQFNAKARSSANFFYGYGEGYTSELAVENARGDLAKQIRTRVESKASVADTNDSVELASLTTTSVSELLVGLRVVKRCTSAENRPSALVSLSMVSFLRNLEGRLDAKAARVSAAIKSLGEAKTNGERFLGVMRAKRLLGKGEAEFREDLSLCRTFAGCRDVAQNGYRELAKAVATMAPLQTFQFAGMDDLAKDLQSELSALLQDEGLIVTREATAQQLRASCRQKLFPKVADVADRFLELSCQVDALIDDVPVSSYAFRGRGAGVSEAEALGFARTQLSRAQ